MNRATPTFDDIVDALLLEEAEPSYDALARWCARHPEHHDALADFFAAWAVQAELPEAAPVDEDRLAKLAVSHALNLAHRQTEEARLDVTAAPRLREAARGAGMSLEELGVRSGLDQTIVAKLDRHLIQAATIPRLVLERLAATLGTAADAVRDMVTGPPLAATGVRWKARRRPSPPAVEDFNDAVAASSLPEEARRVWLEAAAAESDSRRG
jgi:hypothetical protein